MRPKIIYHMTTTIDQKVTGHYLKGAVDVYEDFYYQKHRELNVQGFLCGRVTMQSSFTGFDQPDLSSFEAFPYEDYVGLKKERYAIAIDKNGKLNWQEGILYDDDPGYDDHGIIEILSEDVDPRYLGFLRAKQISYLFAGKKDIDLPLAMEKLNALFAIKTLLMEGGAVTGGWFLKHDLIDALSFVVVPMVEGSSGAFAFGDFSFPLPSFKLVSIEQVAEGYYVYWQRKRDD